AGKGPARQRLPRPTRRPRRGLPDDRQPGGFPALPDPPARRARRHPGAHAPGQETARPGSLPEASGSNRHDRLSRSGVAGPASGRGLGLIGTIGFVVAEWSEKRAEELARLLMRCLDDPSPFTRRGAARVIACSVWKPADDADHEAIRRMFLPSEKDDVPQSKEA